LLVGVTVYSNQVVKQLFKDDTAIIPATNVVSDSSLYDSIKKVLKDNNLISNDDTKVNFNDTGMTTPGDLKIVGQDSTSQVEIKNDSVDSSVQSTDDLSSSSKVVVDISALEAQKAAIKHKLMQQQHKLKF
jgi:hypothetical protein